MLGISIYPEKSSTNEIINYLNTAHKYGYKRVFTCLLSVDKNINNIKKDFTEIINHATSLKMEVILDVAPHVFDKLNIKYDDLSFFYELGATGIRLDQKFNSLIESNMTFNKYNLDIEVNMSIDTHYVNDILDFGPNKNKLIGCHNFYPQRYTGLNLEFFETCSKRFKELSIRSAAFINATSATEGPWEITQGLCTLEMHRDLSSTTQLKHFYAMNLIEDIIIANQFATEEELKKLSEINNNILKFKINLFTNNDIEKKILFEELHFQRGDINDYLIRSTQPRVKYKNTDNPPCNTKKVIKRGSIVIGNDTFGQYKNELQIIKKDIIDDGQRNVVGEIVEEELFLLDYLKPWQKFGFEK